MQTVINGNNIFGAVPETGNKAADGFLQIGIPIILLVVVMLVTFKFIRNIQKGVLSLRDSTAWIVFNVFMFLTSLYLVIVVILSYTGATDYNLFKEIAHYLGISSNNGEEWLTFIILLVMSFIYLRLFQNTLKIAKLRQRIEELSREFAILNGKITETSSIPLEPIQKEKIEKKSKPKDDK
ncbi:MAG: DUF2304 domain-containing protein [Mycoplasma sp.]|nr:DUF2304 domain-containing protein [Mycoplasma sp.]